MQQIFNYYGQFQGIKGRFGGLPSWARTIIAILAIPGLVLLALSILAALVSILALLLLTVPAYRLLSAVCCGPVHADQKPQQQDVPSYDSGSTFPSSGRRHVEVKIIEP